MWIRTREALSATGEPSCLANRAPSDGSSRRKDGHGGGPVVGLPGGDRRLGIKRYHPHSVRLGGAGSSGQDCCCQIIGRADLLRNNVAGACHLFASGRAGASLAGTSLLLVDLAEGLVLYLVVLCLREEWL
jgi:hypothetical protein